MEGQHLKDKKIKLEAALHLLICSLLALAVLFQIGAKPITKVNKGETIWESLREGVNFVFKTQKPIFRFFFYNVIVFSIFFTRNVFLNILPFTFMDSLNKRPCYVFDFKKSDFCCKGI